MFSDGGVAIAEQPAQAAKQSLTIVFGSQTGNAESLAKKFGKEAKAQGFPSTVSDLEGFELSSLAEGGCLLIVTSTYGEGDPPDNAQSFYDALHTEDAPKLDKLQFAVLGLGDSNYPDFCQTAKDFDTRLEALGAQRIAPRADCDVDYDEPADAWWAAVVAAMEGSEASEATAAETTPAETSPETGYSRKNPFPAAILTNVNLNGEGSAKATHHLEFSLEGSGLEYEAGDALGVFPENNAALVDELIGLLGFQPEDMVPLPGGEEGPFKLALTKSYDITKLTSGMVLRIAELTGSAELKTLAEDRKAFTDFAWGREIIDLVIEHKPKWPSAAAFVADLKKLAPRLYSISSSPKAHPGQVHLTVGHVTYESHRRERRGVCSDWLATSTTDQSAPVFVQMSKHFRPPADLSAPMIMVGPGTGIAPFRAFLEEREATGATGPNWLFFGDQKAECDFLYAEQIDGWLKSGLLTRLDTAFSRDQKEKIYVQHRMLENAAQLVEWLENDGCFYVCGDANRMAKDVDRALHEAFEKIKGWSAEEAADYVSKLKKEKRYLRDVY
jgi:sulfite reductase (NADPH) flavoprotein alpha-component